nr:DNA-binding protein [Caproicibacter fermentans]
MDYTTLKEASEKRAVTPRRINDFCTAGLIPGARKIAAIRSIRKR